MGWKNILKFNENIKLTAEWYQSFYSEKSRIRELSLRQIEDYKKNLLKIFNMKVVILAGGLGTRISEYTKFVPKPMISLKGKPLIYHIMKNYAKYGYKEFIIASGYKGNVIKVFLKRKYTIGMCQSLIQEKTL